MVVICLSQDMTQNPSKERTMQKEPNILEMIRCWGGDRIVMVTNLKWNCEETNDDIGEREISNEEICHRLQKREMMVI